jgi:hypothetical protein
MLATTEPTQRLKKLAFDNHMGIRPVFDIGVIDTPIYVNEWWYIPVELDDLNSTPDFVQDRMELILKSNIPVKQLVIRHEAPKLLAAPQVEVKPIEIPWEQIKQVAGVTAKVLAVMAAGIAVAPLVLMGGLLMMLDPALCIVLEDGTVMEVARWFEELSD